MGRFNSMLDYCWKDVKKAKFWKACFAEFLGTCFLVFFGCGSALGGGWLEPTIVQISLTFGLVIASAVRIIGHVSGGHINPAVTIACLFTRKITLIRAVCYVAVQCAGSVVGSCLLKALTPEDNQGTLGQTSVFQDLTAFPQALFIEFMMSFFFIFVIFACCDANRDDLQGSAPLTIGLAAVVSLLFGIKYTGTSMNPARTFGPAVVGGLWTYHYVYWVGPIAGGICAGLIYEFVFSENAGTLKLGHYFRNPHYEPDKIYFNKHYNDSGESFTKMNQN